MNLDKHELKLLVAAMAVAPAGDAVAISLLTGVFDRPGRIHSTVAGLARGGAITFDPYQSVIRVRADMIWKMLNEFGRQPELFTSERPLDSILAENSRLSREKTQAPCDLTRAACDFTQPGRLDMPRPQPEPKPPPDPDHSCSNHAFHAPHAMPEIMPKHAPKPAKPARSRHVHEHVISVDSKKIHGHEHGAGKPTATGHEVGELSQRTTQEMMADIVRLIPSISLENAQHWRLRIDREDAALVNSVIRQAQLQRRSIRNMGGWMNANYLKVVAGTEPKKP